MPAKLSPMKPISGPTPSDATPMDQAVKAATVSLTAARTWAIRAGAENLTRIYKITIYDISHTALRMKGKELLGSSCAVLE